MQHHQEATNMFQIKRAEDGQYMLLGHHGDGVRFEHYQTRQQLLKMKDDLEKALDLGAAITWQEELTPPENPDRIEINARSRSMDLAVNQYGRERVYIEIDVDNAVKLSERMTAIANRIFSGKKRVLDGVDLTKPLAPGAPKAPEKKPAQAKKTNKSTGSRKKA
jgi:hypothetical protein